jgi:hypothetical protein
VPDPDEDFKAKLAASRRRFLEKKAKRNSSTLQLAAATTSGAVSNEFLDQARQSSLEPPALSSTRRKRGGQKQQRGDDPEAKADPSPHSVEAEQAVISSIMQDCQSGGRAVIADVSSKINEHYFYVPAHKTIYSMLVSLWRANRPINLVSFTEFLRNKNILAGVGGAAAVTELHGYIDKITNFVPSAVAVDYYVDTVVEKFARREIIADATRLVRSAYGAGDDFSAVVQRLTNRIAHIGSVNGKFPQLLDTSEFYTTDDPPLPNQVIRYLLHEGGKMLLGGNSKGRKTWALMDLAISVATGADWWGFPTRRGAVCYINLEIQPQFFRMRHKKICEAKNVQPEHGMLFVWNLRGHAKPMSELIKDLLGFLKQYRFKLVIIDPIYKTLPAFRGSENDSAMITQLLNEVETIAVETGAAVLFCSHFSKGDQSEKESMDRVSGSGAWARDPDSLLTMTAHEELDCFTVDATLRNLPPIKPIVVKWDYPLFKREEEMNPNQLKKRKGAVTEKQFTLEELVALLDEPLRAHQYQKRAKEEIGMSSRTFYTIFAEAKKKDLIVETGDRQWTRTANANTANAADSTANAADDD